MELNGYFIAPDRIETPEFTVRSYEPGDGALIARGIRDSSEHLHTFLPFATPDLESAQLGRRLRWTPTARRK